MERSRLSGSVLVLGGIGLVLIGLLAGILAMLFVAEKETDPGVSLTQVAERVDLGRRESVRPVVVPDSFSPPMNLEVSTLNKLFREVSESVTSAVVFIQVDVPASESLPRDWFHDFDNDTRQRLFPDRAPRQSVGSGVILSSDGYIVTNNHVIENASAIQIILKDKRQFSARVIGTDPATDIAILKADRARDLPVINIGDSDRLEVGEWVLAVGNPFRLTSTVTAGIVSALGRQVNIIEDRFGIEDFIQTDAAINPGNSGGALVNLQGELVGISTAIATESGSYEGYGFAIPVNLVERVARDLIAFGKVQRGFLGVEIEEITVGRADQIGLEGVKGVFLSGIVRGGAADNAGLRRGDVVLSINGKKVDAPNELQRAIALYRPGDQLDIEVWRGGKTSTYNVELLGQDNPSYRSWFEDLTRNNRPPRVPDLDNEPKVPDVESFEMSGWGVGIRNLTEREHDAYGIGEGVYISYVKKGSPGARAGLPRDVVIVDIGGTEIQSVDDAIDAFEQEAHDNGSVLVRVKRRNGLTAFYELRAPESE